MTWIKQPHRGIIDGFVVELDPKEGTEINPGNPADKGRRIINLTPGEPHVVILQFLNIISFIGKQLFCKSNFSSLIEAH